MKDKVLLDASALLAAIHNEKGGDIVKKQIERSVISSVNWSEVLQKLQQTGSEVSIIDKSLKALGLEIIDFTEKDAEICSGLWSSGKKLGLSLADRACLATGLRLKYEIITADRVWADLNVDCKIHLIR